jgi:hypothetical protein
MMKLQHEKVVIFIFFMLFFSITNLASAGYKYEFTPSIAISELYDDNIDLDKTNKIFDWITKITPSASLNVGSEKNVFQFRYAPTIVRYKDNDANNTLRHSGVLVIGKEMTSHLRFDLNDTLLRSEDPIEETEGIYGIRRTRNAYLRNNSGASLAFLFGPEDNLRFGYNNSLLKNKDITLDDNSYATPFINLTYWINVRNGVELNYQYSIAEFTRDDGWPATNNYTGTAAGLKYFYRFSTHTTASVGYDLNTREFDGLTEDYNIHQGTIGLSHSFSNDASLSMSGGYFKLKKERSPDDNGYSYSLSLQKNFSHGKISLGGSGGWREGYLEATKQGLIKYYGLNSQLDYKVYERLSNYAGISYMRDNDTSIDRKYKTYSGNYGWKWSFLKWYALSIDYSHYERDDAIDTGDYIVNRVMMTLTASKLFK